VLNPLENNAVPLDLRVNCANAALAFANAHIKYEVLRRLACLYHSPENIAKSDEAYTAMKAEDHTFQHLCKDIAAAI
jgi:hypothetical protein